MADRKISDLTALTTPASGDYLPIVDISEASAANKNKRITIEELLRGAPDGTAAAPSIAFESDPNTGIYSPGADQVAISTNGTGRLTVDTAATTSTLPVVHSLGAVGTPSITFTGDLNTGIYSPGADTIAFAEGGVEAMRIDSNGRLGLGTSAPQGIFSSRATAAVNTDVAVFTGDAVLVDSSAVTAASGNRGPAITWSCNGVAAQRGAAISSVQTDTDANQVGLSFLTHPSALTSGPLTEAMRIDHLGRVGIGTTSPSSLLHLADAGNITVGTTTGTKIGTATTQKLGFYDATPVVQPAAVADATTAIDVITQLNDLLAKLRTLGIIAT